jgi:hypothetical protein
LKNDPLCDIFQAESRRNFGKNEKLSDIIRDLDDNTRELSGIRRNQIYGDNRQRDRSQLMQHDGNGYRRLGEGSDCSMHATCRETRRDAETDFGSGIRRFSNNDRFIPKKQPEPGQRHCCYCDVLTPTFQPRHWPASYKRAIFYARQILYRRVLDPTRLFAFPHN